MFQTTLVDLSPGEIRYALVQFIKNLTEIQASLEQIAGLRDEPTPLFHAARASLATSVSAAAGKVSTLLNKISSRPAVFDVPGRFAVLDSLKSVFVNFFATLPEQLEPLYLLVLLRSQNESDDDSKFFVNSLSLDSKLISAIVGWLEDPYFSVLGPHLQCLWTLTSQFERLTAIDWPLIFVSLEFQLCGGRFFDIGICASSFKAARRFGYAKIAAFYPDEVMNHLPSMDALVSRCRLSKSFLENFTRFADLCSQAKSTDSLHPLEEAFDMCSPLLRKSLEAALVDYIIDDAVLMASSIAWSTFKCGLDSPRGRPNVDALEGALGSHRALAEKLALWVAQFRESRILHRFEEARDVDEASGQPLYFCSMDFCLDLLSKLAADISHGYIPEDRARLDIILTMLHVLASATIVGVLGDFTEADGFIELIETRQAQAASASLSKHQGYNVGLANYVVQKLAELEDTLTRWVSCAGHERLRVHSIVEESLAALLVLPSVEHADRSLRPTRRCSVAMRFALKLIANFGDSVRRLLPLSLRQSLKHVLITASAESEPSSAGSWDLLRCFVMLNKALGPFADSVVDLLSSPTAKFRMIPIELLDLELSLNTLLDASQGSIETLDQNDPLPIDPSDDYSWPIEDSVEMANGHTKNVVVPDLVALPQFRGGPICFCCESWST